MTQSVEHTNDISQVSAEINNVGCAPYWAPQNPTRNNQYISATKIADLDWYMNGENLLAAEILNFRFISGGDKMQNYTTIYFRHDYSVRETLFISSLFLKNTFNS